MQTVTTVSSPFLKNMAALWRLDPRLAQRIDELPPDATVTVEPSRAGPPTATLITRDGRRISLHSRYDPGKEAADFVHSIEKQDVACLILSGMGLGYHLSAIGERFGDDVVVIVAEPDLHVIQAAMEHTDLSAMLASGRVELLTSLDKGVLHDRLARHAAVLALGTRFVAPPVSREVNVDFHAAFRRAVTNYAAFTKMSLVTLVRNAEITCRNIANNLPTYLSTPSLDILRDRFTGKPAVLIAAGPSLARNIDQLRDARDHAVLIAAQTALKPLLARGIKPHFVTSLDFSELSRQFFEGVELPEDLVLVAEPKAAWQVIDEFRGKDRMSPRRVLLLDSAFAHKCVGEALGKKSPLTAGATVMHLAFYLAQHLGCDPIIFVGQDLAFTGHCYYAPDVAIHRAWRAEAGRFSTLEMKEWERIVRHRPILRKVRGADGHEIYTDEQMFTYLEQFERDFARCPMRVIDATQGGAIKNGAAPMPLDEALRQFCTHHFLPEAFGFPRVSWNDASRLGPACGELDERLGRLQEFESLCRETQSLLDELKSLTHDPPRFNRKLARVDELRTQVQEMELIFSMVRDVSQLGELQRLAADRRIAAAQLSDPQRALRQLQRDLQFIRTLLGGVATLRTILADSRRRLIAALDGASGGGT